MFALVALAGLALPATDYTARFAAWKAKYGKAYTNAYDESKAFAAFAHNDDVISKHNVRKDVSYVLAHNEFSGMTSDEFFSGRLGFVGAPRKDRLRAARPTNNTKAVAASVDWVSQGAVTSVKNQGQCGSCWTFSATGAIEGAYAIATGTLESLSEEELVQCDMTDNGCNGGLMDHAFEWVEQNGIATYTTYPYTQSTSTGTRGTCEDSKKAQKAVTITGYEDVPEGDEDALREAVAQQPVSIAIEADKSVFQLYSSGVLDSAECGTKLDHGVLLVGFGTDDSLGKDYWKIKNSWGPTWGESGYIRMVRGSNQCGLANQASYPTGAQAASAVVVED